tara:strand:- start:809 stop:1291 length:483 start_codon:yes stop_codon:yes gene_type:complete
MFIPVLIKRLIIYIPLIIFSKNGSIIKYGVFDPAVIISIEKEVQDGTLTRDEADARYSKFLKSNINRLENKETVINSHFKKVGVDNLDQLRNEMLDENIPVEKIEATLGGMLRIIKAMKKKGNEYEITPRLDSYFKIRLGLKKLHVNYIIRKSKKIARID